MTNKININVQLFKVLSSVTIFYHFRNLVKRNTEVPEHTTEIIREFIKKVFVYHTENINGQKTQCLIRFPEIESSVQF